MSVNKLNVTINNMTIEKIKFINNIKLLDKYKNKKYIYLGSEFCEKNLFTLKDLRDIV